MNQHTAEPDGAHEHAHGNPAAPSQHDARAQHIGTVVQVRDVHGDVHLAGASPPTPAVPRQLPSVARRHFTNRESELDQLARLHQTTQEDRHGELVALSGPGGVGKTALAAHFLNHRVDAFPDGQLYADLAGFSTTRPADPGEVAAGFLRSLGVPPEAIPSDPTARAALLRSHTHGKRVAMLLDNARSAAHVRPLLPGHGPHLVVVTSRVRLRGLLADGASFLDLAPLDPATATDLLTRLLEGTPHATNTGLADLAALCAGLPLALVVAVAPLLLHPHTDLTTTIRRLRDTRLHALSHPEEEQSVTTILDNSYATLSEPAAYLYRCAGWHPGTFDASAAAALSGMAPADTEEAITELLTAHLVEAPAPGRYRLHDLNRDHAQATSTQRCEAERDQAIERMLDHYLTRAAAADTALNPRRFRLALATFQAAHTVAFDDRHTALQWVEEELTTLAALVRLAHETGRHTTCWRLCETLKATLMLTKHYTTWETCYSLGLASAQELDDPEAEAFMRMMLGSYLLQAHRDTDAAMNHHFQALRLWRSVGHRQGQASTYESIGTVALANGSHDQALTAFTRSLDIHLELDEHRGSAIQHRFLGDTHRSAGNHPCALAHYDKALQYFRSINDDYMAVRTLIGLATTHLQREEIDQARTHAEEAHTLAEKVSARHEIANALMILADIAHHRGDSNEQDYLHRAHQLFTQLASPNASITRERLNGFSTDDWELKDPKSHRNPPGVPGEVRPGIV